MLIDDEPLARRNLRVLLRGDPEIELVKECSNGGDAVSIREALQRLEISAYKIAESMYGGASNG